MEAVTIILLASISLSYAGQAGYNIRPITQSGVLFEHVGKANFYTRHWTILSKVEMPDLTIELEFANNCSSLVIQLCARVNHTELGNRCELATKEIGSWMSKIKRQDDELKHHTHAEPSHRRKRSIFDGIGSLSKTLFGTMDHTDSENIYSTLKDLDGRENRTFTLLQDQTTVITSTFKLFNASRVKAAAEREELWNKITAITAAQQSQDLVIMTLTRRVEINEILTLMTLHLREISDVQESYASMLVALSLGRLHPMIIHARELTEIMTNATRQLDLAEEFLDFQLLTQIAKVSAMQGPQHIMVRIDIPKPERVAFELYKIYTIPAVVDKDGYHIYELGAEFLAANNHDRQYVLLDYQQYGKCQQLTTLENHLRFLCPQLGPIFTAIGDSCVLNLFRSFNVNPMACKEKVLPKWNSLVRMITRNHWLFVMSGKTKLEVNCRGAPTAIGELVSTGVLSIEEHCHLQIGDLLITSEDHAQRNITLWQPSFSELPSWESMSTRTGSTKSAVDEDRNRKVRLLAADNANQAWRDHAANIQKMNDAITKEEIHRQQSQPHNIHLAATSLTGLLSVASFMLVAGVLIHRRCRKQKPVPDRSSRLSILPITRSSAKPPVQTGQPTEDKGTDDHIQVIVPTTATLPTTNLPTIVGKQLVHLA